MQDLVAAFLAAAPSLRGTPAEQAALAASLNELVAAGRAAWPRLALTATSFVARQARRVAAGEVTASTAGAQIAALQPHAADLYLAAACADGVAGAAEAFDALHLTPVPRYLARMKPQPTFIDEVRQQLRVKLLLASGETPPRIGEYAGRGPLASWVRVASLNLALSLHRAADSALESMSHAERVTAATGSDPEAELLGRRYRPEIEGALKEALTHLDPAHREVLRLYYVDGMTVDALGAHLGVGRSTAARRVAEARRLALEALKQLLRARLALGSGTVDSLTRQLRSQLDLSLSGLLR